MSDHLPWASKVLAVPASRASVLRVLTDLDAAAQWLGHRAVLHPLTPGAFGHGTGWRETRRVAGVTIGRTMMVEAHTATGFLAAGAVDDGPVYTLRYTVTTQSTGSCHVLASLQPRSSGHHRGRGALRPPVLRPEQIFCWLLRSDLIGLAQAAMASDLPSTRGA